MENRECGAGMYLDGNSVEVRPHAVDCAALRAAIEREQLGHCMTCDARFIVEHDRERGGFSVWCPNGHSATHVGENALQLLDAIGSGWIREEINS